MQWREENKIEAILESGLDPEMVKQFPFHYDAVDKEGGLGK